MTTTTDRAAEVLAATQAAADRIRERAPEADQQRRLHPETLADLHEAGLMRMTVPQSEGGSALPVETQMQVYEVIGGACASSAWCLGNHNAVLPSLRKQMAPAAGNAVIGAIVNEGAMLAHATAPSGQARKADGGYRISGRWPFISGSLLARWAILSMMVEGPEPGGPSDQPLHNRWMLVHLDHPEVTIDPTWQAMSVRASMSHDVVVEDLFIPEDETMVFGFPPDFLEVLGKEDDPPETRMPLGTVTAMVAALAVGVAQAAIDEVLDYAGASSMIFGGSPSGTLRGQMPGNQFAVAEALIWNESGRAFLRQEARSLDARAAAGGHFSFNDVTRLFMAMVHARDCAQKAVDRVFSVRGAHGLYESGNFERYYRDVRMPALHGALTADLFKEMIAKEALGIPPDHEPRWG